MTIRHQLSFSGCSNLKMTVKNTVGWMALAKTVCEYMIDNFIKLITLGCNEGIRF